ncbi:MAG: protein phosphatase 2C domain-containing protein, partial [Myxococcota bacterium]|nr:protein phosphatase 2C domain-containing protein [Myxococcota bacterium]
MQLHVHGISDVGQERQQNEDMMHTERLGDGSWLLVVCDGMGGHEAGNVASEVATRRIVEQVAARIGDPSPA